MAASKLVVAQVLVVMAAVVVMVTDTSAEAVAVIGLLNSLENATTNGNSACTISWPVTPTANNHKNGASVK